MTKNPHAQALGKLGGKAGLGSTKPGAGNFNRLYPKCPFGRVHLWRKDGTCKCGQKRNT